MQIQRQRAVRIHINKGLRLLPKRKLWSEEYKIRSSLFRGQPHRSDMTEKENLTRYQ